MLRFVVFAYYVMQSIHVYLCADTPTDGYNPEDPGLNTSKGFIPTPLIPSLPLRGPFPPPLPHMPGVAIPPPPSLALPPLFNTSTTVTPSFPFRHPRPRPPPPTGHVPMRPSDTLIIRKVPRELNTITKLSSHFEKFGTIVNLTVSASVIVHTCTHV